MQTWMIYEGNALKRLHELPNDSIHCGVGSPPYWGGLRNYLGNPEQLGHEPHPRLYALDLADIMDVVKDKLRPEGTFWLNLGDSYIGSGGAGGDYNEGGMKEGQDRFPGSRKTMGDFEWADPLVRWAAEMSGYADYTEHAADVRADMLNELLAAGWSPPSKLKLTDQASAPWECAMELRQRGWWLRCDVIWHKKNVKPGGGHLKRPTIDHEYLFQLCKSEQTYYDSFAVKVPAKKEGELRNRRSVWHIGVSTWKDAASGAQEVHHRGLGDDVPMRLPYARARARARPLRWGRIGRHCCTEAGAVFRGRRAGGWLRRDDRAPAASCVSQRGWPSHAVGVSYDRGEELGCPDCAAGESHVCPFLIADDMPEPQRSWVIQHILEEI
jgi:hypothetical protein